MAVPEGYTEVGLIGLVNKGNYDPLTEYSKYNFVYYQGSTYLYINELPQSGVTPSDDGVTWQYMSRGMIMDNTPTQGSPNAVTSGGIYDSERALKTEIQNEQTAATTKATDTNNVLGQGTVTNATNVQALLDNVTDKDTNPTKDSAKTVISGGVYSADKATREMIAPVEENATSSAPYAIGEQLIFNGVLCEATSAISIGDTLAMGTNLSTANKITNRDSTPTANSTKLVTSGGVYSADNQIRENIANVEGATSAHPYTVGKQLIFNGLLCKATSAIAVGDTLAVGTNLALADNVVEQIYSLNQGLTNSLSDMNNVLGAKNLLPNNAESLTYGGITFTVNSDGSVTANGTATKLVLLFYVQKFKPNNGNYILSGGIRNGAFAFVNENNGTTFVRNVVSIGNDTQFTLNYSDYDNLDCGVGIESGVTVNNETFYPMLRPASIQDNTYVPYSMTNREMTPYVQSISNPNLLDNPWFTVNQRGQSSFPSVNYAYWMDRWKLLGKNSETIGRTITLDDGINVSAGTGSEPGDIVCQVLEKERFQFEKVYTLSVMLDDGKVYSVSGILPTPDGTYKIPLFTVVSGKILIRVTEELNKNIGVIASAETDNMSFKIKAMKLELGSISTLAMDTAPNYATELLKCQRYCIALNQSKGGYDFVGQGIAWSNSQVTTIIPIPVTMRAKPSITDISKWVLFNPSRSATITSANVAILSGNSIKIEFNTSSEAVQQGDMYFVGCESIGDLLLLSADL